MSTRPSVPHWDENIFSSIVLLLLAVHLLVIIVALPTLLVDRGVRDQPENIGDRDDTVDALLAVLLGKDVNPTQTGLSKSVQELAKGGGRSQRDQGAGSRLDKLDGRQVEPDPQVRVRETAEVRHREVADKLAGSFVDETDARVVVHEHAMEGVQGLGAVGRSGADTGAGQAKRLESLGSQFREGGLLRVKEGQEVGLRHDVGGLPARRHRVGRAVLVAGLESLVADIDAVVRVVL